MIKCPACDELITPNCNVYQASSGFVNVDGGFFVDSSVIIHQSCYYDYLFNPFEKLEENLKG